MSKKQKIDTAPFKTEAIKSSKENTSETARQLSIFPCKRSRIGIIKSKDRNTRWLTAILS